MRKLLSYFKFLLYKNGKLSEDFYHRISAIILLFSGLLSYNSIYNLDSFSGIGIYSGLFNITTHSQILESFLLIIGSIILVSWPNQEERIIEVKNSNLPNSYNTSLHKNSYLYTLLNSILSIELQSLYKGLSNINTHSHILYLYLLSRANQVRIDDYYTIYYIPSLILNTTQQLFNYKC